MDWRVCGRSAFDVPAASFEVAVTECWGSAGEVEGRLQALTLPTIFTHDLESFSAEGEAADQSQGQKGQRGCLALIPASRETAHTKRRAPECKDVRKSSLKGAAHVCDLQPEELQQTRSTAQAAAGARRLLVCQPSESPRHSEVFTHICRFTCEESDCRQGVNCCACSQPRKQTSQRERICFLTRRVNTKGFWDVIRTKICPHSILLRLPCLRWKWFTDGPGRILARRS